MAVVSLNRTPAHIRVKSLFDCGVRRRQRVRGAVPPDVILGGLRAKINLVFLAILGPKWAPGGVMGGFLYLFGQPKAKLVFATPESETASKMVQI